MPLQYTCFQCQRLFAAPPSRGRNAERNFCSRACYAEHRAQSHVDIPCATCGKVIHAGRIYVRPDRKYCSFACYIAAPKVWAQQPIDKTCRQCGRAFTVTASGQHRIDCSDQCAREGRSATAIPCVICGKTFRAKPSELAKGKRFCSFACRDAESRAKRHRTCEVCGASYVADKGNTPSRFCSGACRVESRKKPPERFDCLYCGTPVVRRAGQAPGQYCSISCASAHRVRVMDIGFFKPTRTAARELALWDVRGWLKIARRVRKRDGYQCRHCGLQWERGMRTLEVHHIIPRRLGGTHDLANLVTLCTHCHRITDMALRMAEQTGG